VRNAAGIEFVYVPAGSFMMGANNLEGAAQPVHQVAFSEGFYMGKYEVTQAQWKNVMGTNPSEFKGNNLPVETVSWLDATEFVRKLNEVNHEYTYRLSSEAEWEYACRAGTTGDYAGDIDAMAWYDTNSGSKTHPVGTKQPNAFGLYDMNGNVMEWCQDWHHLTYDGAPVDGSAWEKGGSHRMRVYRGGAWIRPAFPDAYSANRGFGAPDRQLNFLGLRLVAVARF
jgi:formylglycine-generating enzyme required for sulfatase activity